MATVGEVSKLKRQVKRLNGIREMRKCLLNDNPTKEIIVAYYKADDDLDDKLSELYASNLMFMKVAKPELFEIYVDLTKEDAKRRMLRHLTKFKQDAIGEQMIVKRIFDLREELSNIKKKPIPKSKELRIRKTLKRLEYWAKEINYE